LLLGLAQFLFKSKVLPEAPTIEMASSATLTLLSGTFLSGTSPEPVQSMASIIFCFPSLVFSNPGAPTSTPVSRIAITVPLPSYSGFFLQS